MKRWVCLFTCVAVRAIHLELVNDLSAQEFLRALRRFIARRGKPIELISDNAPQFKLGKSVIERVWLQTTTDPDIQSYVADQGIGWNFIIEFAPWQGGFYERLVGLVKLSLKKSLGKSCLSSKELETVIVEVEAVLNSRPLVYVGCEIDSGVALTPAHFLAMKPQTGAPILQKEEDPEFFLKISSSESLTNKWKFAQQYLNRFWNIWRNEYVLSLRERYAKVLKQPRIKSSIQATNGTVVLIKENLPRGSWKMGIISELITGRDGKSRAAIVRLPNGKLIRRALSFLFPMECGTVNDNITATTVGVKNEPLKNEDSSIETRARPRRAAAIAAKRRIEELFESNVA